MSDFSNKLQFYLERLNLSAYRLSKLSGMERTGIHRVITGQRLPSDRFMFSVLPHLRLNHMEEKELWKLLTIERIGRETFEERLRISQIFWEIDRYRKLYSSGVHSSFSKDIDQPFNNKSQVVNLRSQHQVRACLHGLLKSLVIPQEGGELYFNFTENLSLIADLLLQLDSQEQSRLHIHQYVEVSRGDPSDGSDLEILRRILPLALSFHGAYDVFYAYSSQTENDPLLRLFPCCLLAGEYTLRISSDWNSGLLIHSSEITRSFAEEFQRLHSRYNALIDKRAFSLDAVEYYCFTVQNGCAPDYVYESWPCLMRVLGEVASKIDSPQLRPYMGVANQLSQNYYNLSDHITHYFALEGMEEFVRTGVLPGYAGLLAGPVPTQERGALLKKICGQAEEHPGSDRLIRTNQFPVIPGLFVEIYGRERVCIGHQDPKFPFIILCLTEPHICSAFYDFFESMDGSDMLYSEEETQKLISGFLLRSNEQLSKEEELS